GAGPAGALHSDDADGASARRCVSASTSDISVGNAAVEAGPPSAAASRSASRVAGLRFTSGFVILFPFRLEAVFGPAIVRRPQAECAACRHATRRGSRGSAPQADRRTGTA